MPPSPPLATALVGFASVRAAADAASVLRRRAIGLEAVELMTEAGIDLAVALTASGTVRDVRRATGPVHGAQVLPIRGD